MSDLPTERLQSAPPFTYCGIDVFGPFFIKIRRSTVKRYGLMITCLSSRAVHLEVVHTLETDSFIMALRRFLSKRGPVRMIRSDNATNFVGAQKELEQEQSNVNNDKVRSFLLEQNADWILWKRNAPYAATKEACGSGR